MPEPTRQPHGGRSRTGIVATLPFLLLVGALPGPTAAQGILGRVLDAEADTVIAGAAVTLVDSGGSRLVTSTTDSAGSFGLPVYAPGRYTLHVEHVAYREAETRALEVGRRDMVRVDIRLSRLAFDLDPLVVTARQRAPTSYLTEYYERLDRAVEYGWGVVLTREDLEELEGYSVGDVLERPALVGRFLSLPLGGLACSPAFYWNGFPVPVRQIPVSSVEGIEIYRRHEVPAEYGSYHPCGVVLVWNRPVRPGEDAGRASGWQRVAMAVGAALLAVVVVR